MPEKLTPGSLLEPACIVALMDLMRQRGVVSFRVRAGEEELEVRWPDVAPAGREVPALAVPGAGVADPGQGVLHAVLSPTVGTYFTSSEPGRPPFVKVGDRVVVGQTICVVESMKLMSEIVSDVAGVVVELPVPNGGSVQAGQLLGLIRLDDGR